MRTISAIVVKEARELFTRQMLIPLVAMTVLFAFLGQAIRSERKRSQAPQKLLVSDLDQSDLAREVIETITTDQIAVLVSQSNPDTLLALAARTGASWVIIVPAGLSDSIGRQSAAELSVYNLVQGFSITQTMKGFEVKARLEQANRLLAQKYLSKAYPSAEPASLQRPLRPREYVVVHGRTAPGSAQALQNLVLSQTMMIPLILLMVIIYSSQMIAASIGQEKENKTLETLLTVPVSRTSIVVGKMLGAALVALVVAGVVMAGMFWYMSSLTGADISAGGSGTGFSELGVGLRAGSLLLVGLSLFVAVLAALSLATLLAVFAGDAKSAQMSITPVMILVLIPYLFTMFFDVSAVALPLRLIIYAIPFSYPFLAPRALFFGQAGVAFIGLAYMSLFAAACILAAARVFDSERVFTTKLRLRRDAGA